MLSTISRNVVRRSGFGLNASSSLLFARSFSNVDFLNKSLDETDPELFGIIKKEEGRQRDSLVLIASENFSSKSTSEVLGSCLSNKYSEGYPGKRYYGGNEYIDQVETLCQQRALQAFSLNPGEWGVNVQSLSGSPANFQTYSAILEPHDRILAMDLPHGGHLSHGYQLPTKKISMVSKYFDTLAYRLNPETGTIDYDEVEHLAERYRPKLIICGASSYPREIDYARFREIADTYGAYLMCDMAHISGLVSAGCLNSPFEYAHIVTTTTHKSLRGPRGAMIFYKKSALLGKGKKAKPVTDLEDKINAAVFPGLQGGPHNHTIGALATSLHQACREDFKEYQRQVVKNAKTLATALMDRGYNLISGGTDNHLVLVNLKQSPCNIDGGRVERVLELANVTTNKNTVVGDRSALIPGGIRLGSPACTSRGMTEEDFEQIAQFFHEGVEIAVNINSQCEGTKLRDFLALLEGENYKNFPEIEDLKQRVTVFASRFPTIGY